MGNWNSWKRSTGLSDRGERESWFQFTLQYLPYQISIYMLLYRHRFQFTLLLCRIFQFTKMCKLKSRTVNVNPFQNMLYVSKIVNCSDYNPDFNSHFYRPIFQFTFSPFQLSIYSLKFQVSIYIFTSQISIYISYNPRFQFTVPYSNSCNYQWRLHCPRFQFTHLV